jgi:hypothetical protein
MSTALTTSHHRFSDPLGISAAVLVVVGALTVLGVAVTTGEQATPARPTAPAQARVQTDEPPSSRIGLTASRQQHHQSPPSRVGLGDFTQP